MRLEQVKYFVEVAKCHSIGIAAEKLFVTQPNISIAIKNFEKELDCILFERSKNGMYLTEIGNQVLKKAENILREENDILQLIEKSKEESQQKLQGLLNILSVPMIMHSLLQNTILAFFDHNPEMKIIMKENFSRYALESILSLECDLGLVILSDEEMLEIQNNGAFYCRKLFSEKIYVVAHRKFNLKSKKSINCNDFYKLPVVSTEPFPISFYSRHQKNQSNEEANVILCTYSFNLMKAFVLSGHAVTILTSSMATMFNDHDMLDMIPISDLDHGNVCCLYSKKNEKMELILAFESELLKHC